jgi:hypothetical protein
VHSDSVGRGILPCKTRDEPLSSHDSGEVG